MPLVVVWNCGSSRKGKRKRVEKPPVQHGLPKSRQQDNGGLGETLGWLALLA
jgi:hypothetical protein